MKDNDLLMIVLAFFLGFCFHKLMGGRLVEGDQIDMTNIKKTDQKIQLISCVATEDDTTNNVYYAVNDRINSCTDRTYNDCHGETTSSIQISFDESKDINHTCTPYANSYIRRDGNCPEGYKATDDTGFTYEPRNPPGCVDSCGWGGCWLSTECTTKGTEKDETNIELCKNENINDVTY